MRIAPSVGTGTVLPGPKSVKPKKSAAALLKKKQPPKPAAPKKPRPKETFPPLEESVLLSLGALGGIPGRARNVYDAVKHRATLAEVLNALERLEAAGLISKATAAVDPADTTWRTGASAQPGAVSPHRAGSPLPFDLQPALIRLADSCEEAIKADFESGSAILEGTRDLIAFHPELRDYHEALNWIVEGEHLLNQRCGAMQYRPAPEHHSAAIYRMANLYEDARDANFEDGINKLIGAGDLIAHHPGLCEYHQAIRWMADGYSILLEMVRQVRAL